MDPLCLLVAGVVRATMPASEFTVDWMHSVQKTRWEERYRTDGDGLLLIEAKVQGSGAGMEPPPEARLIDGAWTWNPQRRLPSLRITRSGYTADYRLCWNGGCRELAAMIGPTPEGTAVDVQPCAAAPR